MRDTPMTDGRRTVLGIGCVAVCALLAAFAITCLVLAYLSVRYQWQWPATATGKKGPR